MNRIKLGASFAAATAGIVAIGILRDPQPQTSHSHGLEVPAQIQQAYDLLEEAQLELIEFVIESQPEPEPEPEPEPTRASAPPIPDYHVPTAVDCEWIIGGGVARSTKGLPDVSGEYLIGQAYKASRAAGQPLPITIGIHDDGGEAVFGGGWSLWSDRSVAVPTADGQYESLSVELLGLNMEAEASISWDVKWGKVEYLAAFNLGLRGQNDSFIIRANEGIGTLILDGCWWLQAKGFAEGVTHASGMHIDNWDTLVWRNHQWRGIALREHSAYLKSCVGAGTWIVDNDLRGGNRTGFQVRPTAVENAEPSGPLVISGNYADGYGWNWGSTPQTADGGSCISVWANPNNPTWVLDNNITNARYGCMMFGAQSKEQNWVNAAGFTIGEVHVHGNTFTNPLASRPAVSITAVEKVVIGENKFTNLTLNDPWGMNLHGVENGQVLFETLPPSYPVWTFDGTYHEVSFE